MVRATLLSFVILFTASSVFAGEVETPELEAAPALEVQSKAQIAEQVKPTEGAAELPETCSKSELQTTEWMQESGFFGPHCSPRPGFQCNLVEGGLGPLDCSCTYRCDCSFCNGRLTQINCELIENDGCFACPTASFD